MTVNQRPLDNDTTTYETTKCNRCGHLKCQHGSNGSHICESCNKCWAFEAASTLVVPSTSTAASADHVSDRIQHSELSDEQKFALYFADANRQIDELESEANEKKSKIDSDLLKSKIEIVKDLAKKIEKEGFPIGGIANEIVHQLKGRISPTHIRDNLDDKYKDRRQSNNAKKRKVATPPLPLLPKQQPGHHRLRVCNELKIPVGYIVKNFQDKPLDELKFVITVNLNRRQFNAHERAQIAFKLNKVYKETGRLMKEWGKFNHSSHSSNILPTLKQ